MDATQPNPPEVPANRPPSIVLPGAPAGLDGRPPSRDTAEEVALPNPAEPKNGPLTDPHLTAKLRADYDALQNDVQQARELAADFQRQLAGKSNEFADLKRVFSETRSHLTRLEASITELREERHRLASEAMRGVAFERKLAEKEEQVARLDERVSKLREERHRLAADAMRATALERKLVERDAQIAQLTTDLTNLREQLTRGKARAPEPEPPAGWRGLFSKKK